MFAAIDAIVAEIRNASWKEREALKQRLIAAGEALEDRAATLNHLEDSKKDLPGLELRWEIDEVIEALTPPPVEEPAEEPEPEEEPKKPLTAADLDLVYDDPRGLMLHKSKVGDRWFATQANPQTGQPQTFELRDTEVSQLRLQLNGSPYWIKQPGSAN